MIKLINKIYNFTQRTLVKSGAGFTLLEIILYLAIVGILLVAVVNFHLSLAGSTTKTAAHVDVANSRRAALNSIDYLINNADGLWKDADENFCSDLVSDPPVLGLYFDSDDYLPGTCVGSGGGTELTVVDNRLTLTCYPDIPNNGDYLACDENTYGSGETYYLSPPSLQLQPAYLNFSTSTPTTTNDTFLTVTTNLSFNTVANGQVALLATSTASSTAMLRNERHNMNSLIGWWKMDDGDKNNVTNERGTDGTCPTAPALNGFGTVNGFDDSELFDESTHVYCGLGEDVDFIFKESFTLAAWVTTGDLSALRHIFSKINSGSKVGYAMGTTAQAKPFCEVCNGSTCNQAVSGYTLSSDRTYHFACVYNLHSANRITIYTYLEATGLEDTTTDSTDIILVNYDDPYSTNDQLLIGSPALGTYVDGSLNDLRAYARALSADEIAALESRGANDN